jgi:DHA1 family multidrug resistance protein-like MFS transporter
MKLPSAPLLVLLGCVFVMQVGNGMVWSMIAVGGKSLGASAGFIGLMVSAFGGARLLINIPAGYASERFGRRRMMSLGCVVTAISSFAVAATFGLNAFFAGLLFMGISSAVIVTSALAAVVDLGEPERRLQDMSMYQGVNVIGISMGPAMGGLAAGLWGYSSVFFVNGIIALFGIVAFALMPWPKAASETKGPRSAPVRLRTLAKEGFYVGLIFFSLFYVRVASNWILMPLIALSRFDLSVSTIGLILTTGAASNFSILFFTPHLARLFGRVRIIVLSCVLTLAGCAVLALADRPELIWLSSILFGISGGVGFPNITAYAADIAPADQRGPVMGLLRTAQDLALIVGPLFTGLLADHLGLGFQGGLLGCLVLLTLATVVFGWRARGI